AVTWANPAGVRRFGWDKVIGATLAERVERAALCRSDHTPLSISEDPVAIALATRRHVLDQRVTVETAPGRWEWFTGNGVRLVDDLLDLSRIVHGKFQLRFESFDLREQVKSAAEPFEETAALRRVRLTLTLPPAPVTMWGDGARMQQIASNLIANAVKFTP